MKPYIDIPTESSVLKMSCGDNNFCYTQKMDIL